MSFGSALEFNLWPVRFALFSKSARHYTLKLKSKKAYFFNCERHLSGLFYNYLENFIPIEFMWRVDQIKSRWYSSFEFSFIYDFTFNPTYKSFFRKWMSHSLLQATLWRIWCCYQAYRGSMGRIFIKPLFTRFKGSCRRWGA